MTDPTTLAETIARLTRLLKAAQPGPWFRDGDDVHSEDGTLVAAGMDTEDAELIEALYLAAPVLLACAERVVAIDGLCSSDLDQARDWIDLPMYPAPRRLFRAIVDAAAERDALAKRVGELEREVELAKARHSDLAESAVRPLTADLARLRAENERLAKLQWDVARALGMMHEPDNAAEWPASVEQLLGGVAALKERAEKAEKNYRFMVERAADEKLDGYRELGQRAADAENQLDDTQRALTAAQDLVRELQTELDLYKQGQVYTGWREAQKRVRELEEAGQELRDVTREAEWPRACRAWDRAAKKATGPTTNPTQVAVTLSRPSCVPADCQHYIELPSGLWAWVEGEGVHIQRIDYPAEAPEHRRQWSIYSQFTWAMCDVPGLTHADFLAARALGVRALGWAK